MAKKYWTGATNGVLTTATNFQGGVALVDGDELWLTQLAVRSITSALTLAGVALAKVVATRGFLHSLGGVGNELEPENGIGEFRWEATGEDSEAHIDTEIDFGYINTSSKKGLGVILHGTAAGDEETAMHFVDGLITLDANYNFVNASIIRMDGGRLVIPSGVTLGTGNRILQNGGRIESAQTIINYRGRGGELYLSGTAAATLIDLCGEAGLVTLASTGTIAEAHVDAGVLDSRTFDLARTITSLYGGGTGRALLGHDTTVTSAVQGNGWRPEYPV